MAAVGVLGGLALYVIDLDGRVTANHEAILALPEKRADLLDRMAEEHKAIRTELGERIDSNAQLLRVIRDQVIKQHIKEPAAADSQ